MAYAALRQLYELPPRLRGLEAFDLLMQRAGAPLPLDRLLWSLLALRLGGAT